MWSRDSSANSAPRKWLHCAKPNRSLLPYRSGAPQGQHRDSSVREELRTGKKNASDLEEKNPGTASKPKPDRAEKDPCLRRGPVRLERTAQDHGRKMAQPKAGSARNHHSLSTGQAGSGRTKKDRERIIDQASQAGAVNDHDVTMDSAKTGSGKKELSPGIRQEVLNQDSHRRRGERTAISEPRSAVADQLEGSNAAGGPTTINAETRVPALAVRVRDLNGSFVPQK